MMLTIHGLPVMVKYHELKTMIKQECNLNDFILDNLTADVDGYKKVRIGVADEGEGAHLCKCLNGFRMGGSVLRVVPVGKAPIQTNFDQRGGFMVRNDVMPNQQGNYANQPGTFGNQFNQPQAQNPWNTGSQNNQWSGNQPPQNQMRPSNFDYQQRPGHQFPGQQQSIMGMSPGNKSFGQSGPAFNQSRPGPTDQGFGFMQKPGVPQTATQIRSERSHVLRSVDIVQTPVHTNRYSEQKYDQNKPVVINKDNFQGPGQFNTSQQGYPQGSIQPVPWSKLQQKSPFGKPDVSPFEGNQRPKDFEKSTGSHDRKVSPQDRRVHSASGPLRPPDRRPSPVRRVSPGRRNSPGRRMSPGRRVSPSDRRAPIRKSPTRSSPLKRTSPGRRLVSPGRENLRYSPSRRHDKPDYADSRGSKSVRPAYEPDAKAPNQAMYSDGYRPHVRDNVTYSARQNDQRSSSWQDRDKNTFPGGKNQDDDRRIVRGAEQEAKRSPIRKSRSPNRRDVRERSPLRDRYRRHSPSPRSPRRSWALEKRRSPEISDAPPPPVWPGQTQEVPYPRSTTKADGTKHIPVWDHRTYEETEDALRRENRSYDEEQMRIRRDGGRRDEIPHSNRREPSPRRHDFKSQEERNRDPKFEPRDPKFAPRDPKFDHRDPKFELREPHVSRFDQRDPKFEARGPEFRSRDPKFEERDPKFPPHVPRFEPREPKLDVRAPHFEPRDPKFEQRNPRDPKFDSREPKFEPRDSKFDKCHAKYDSHDPKFELREPKFDIRDPKFGSRDLNYGPRDPKFEAREPKFEPRDPKFEPRGPKFDPRDPKFDPRDPKFDPRDPKFDPRDPKFDPRDPKFEPREPKFEPRDQKFESRGPKFEPRDPKFEQRGPKFEPRDPKFEPRDPKFELRNPKFEPRGPKFEPRDLTFEPRDPKFEPRDPKLEQRGPKFETRDPKFDPRDPKYNSRDPNYRPRSPTFESRDPKLVPRRNEFAGGFDPSSHKPHPRDRDYEPQDPNFVSAREKLRARDTKYEHRESKFKPTFEPVASDFPRELDCERNPKYGPRDPKFDSDYKDHHRADTERDDFRHKKREPNREEIHRQDERKEIRHPRDPIDEEFEDIYKRTIEFKQKVEELKRVERNRENYARDGRRDDRRKNDESDRPYREDYHKMDLERHSHEDRPRSRHSDEKREPEWKSREVIPRKIFLPPAIKVKRDKAVEEIVNKLMHKYGNFEMTEEMKNRANDELKLSVSRIMFDMFGTEDISFIELVVKFNSKHGQKEELKIFEDVMSCFPKHHRILKRPAQDANNSEIPEKSTRVTAHNEMDQVSDWNFAFGQQAIGMTLAQFEGQLPLMMNSTPMMVPSPFSAQDVYPSQQTQTAYAGQNQEGYSSENREMFTVEIPKEDGYNLYLCKDDFKQFSDNQAEYLKKFLISQIFKVTETSQGWAPDFTLKGLQSLFRYELHTNDERSKDWLLNLDFSEFTLFSVLVYTKEELWYERAAIWLPGHSRCRNIEPLDKLKLQNKKLDEVKIGKWKLVKKIVNVKGTRIYVDMPPSSARALEKHKMMLSYELQKVNIFLKAVAVDKDAFDVGLLEISLKDQSEILNAAQNSIMPVLKEDPNIVKLSLKGSKTLTIVQARKIKEMVIYQLFKYHQQGIGKSKTDFVKFGFCQPNSLGILPENPESKRWLISTDFGKLNRQPIVVLGEDDHNTRYIKLLFYVPHDHSGQSGLVLERLKQSNQGVKGINFALWKPINFISDKRSKYNCEVEVDLESAENIAKNKYKLDYLSDNNRYNTKVAEFKPDCSESRFKEKIAKLKAELTDSYDVANMELASSDSENEDVICLDN